MSFTKDFFINNRKRLAEILPDCLIVISANKPMQRSGDSPYPFKQDGNFWYFTGINEPNIALVIDTKNSVEYIVVPDQTKEEEIFNGRIDTAEMAQISGINNYMTTAEAQKLGNDMSSYKKVYVNLAKKRTGLVINLLRSEVYNEIKNHVNSVSDLRPITDKLRMLKQPPEIYAITKAAEITKKALIKVENAIEEGLYNEQKLLSIINQDFAKECVVHAYEPIVASGKNANTLHYIKNNHQFDIKAGAILLDVGAEFNNYSADISRTFAIGNNKKAQAIIQAVTLAQQQIIGFLQPGLTWKKLHKFSELALASSLSNVGEDVNEGNIKQYFPHSVGHFLGLNVHDTGDYRQPLAENMVITIEPGYYNSANGFGVRVEDDVLITSNGAVIL